MTDNPYVRKLVEEVLPKTDGDWDGAAYARRGTRSATYIALGLLWRNTPADRKAATAILRELVALQYDDDEKSKRHGVWPTRVNETKLDENWREFVGTGLILVLAEYGEALPDALVADIRAVLLRAAQGARRRNVGAGYTNIAIMSAFLLDYVGTKEKRDDLRDPGRKKAEEIQQRFNQHKTFDEYNSPTYYGCDLMGLGLWRRHASWPRMRQMGREMEADLWRDIAAFYHPDMKNMCGPFVRAYGMDMTEYVAITGLWIAMALDDPKLAPLPQGKGRKSGEMNYAPVIAILHPEVPEDALPRLRTFKDAARSLKRVHSRGVATAYMDKTLMLGASRLNRRWDQHFPATIHWKIGEAGLGWVALSGLNEHVEPVVKDATLRISRTAKSKEALLFHIAAPGVTEDQIKADRWQLPGRTIAVERGKGVSLSSVKAVKHTWFGPCLEVQYETPNAALNDALVLKPE